MRGRRPSGPEYVDHLEGSAQAKQRLKVVLETLAGTCRVQEACQRLGISEPRFHQLRARVLEAALERLEPRPAGRPPQPPAPEQEHLQELAARAAAEDLAVRTAQAREEIALTLPRVVHEPPEPEKKTRPPRAPAKRRRRGKKRRT
jgi:hypothetical protein